MNCDMCGADGQLFKANVEGSVLVVCKNCSAYGEVIQPVRKVESKRVAKVQPKEEPEMVLDIVDDYGSRIKSARESKGLNQEELGKLLHEKVSLLHKIETGHHEPNIPLARKIEKFLHITLIEVGQDEGVSIAKTEASGMTIGDFIKVRKRQ